MNNRLPTCFCTEQVKQIGCGAYAKVFHPPPPLETSTLCDSEKKGKQQQYALDRDHVLKYGQSAHLSNEFLLSGILKEIDPNQEYFIHCKCLYTPDAEIVGTNNHPSNIGLIYTYGGLPWTTVPKTYQVLWNIYSHLVKALKLLQDARILHLDISYKNIMLDLQTMPKIRLIDFGLAIAGDNLLDKLLAFLSSHNPLDLLDDNPLFLTIWLKGELMHRLQITEEECKVQYVKEYDYLWKHYTPARDWITEWFSYSKEKIAKELITPNLHKIDLFRLSSLVNVYFLQLNTLDVEQDSQSKQSLSKLICHCLHPDPTKSYSVDQALQFIIEAEQGCKT